MPRTQQERNEQTRRALLEAGGALLSEVGYARTSVPQITQRAQRAHGTFYLHFENKQQLVSVLLDGMAAEALASARLIGRTAGPVDAIWLTFQTFLSDITPERSLWLLLEEVVALEPDAALLRSRLRHHYVQPVLRGVERSSIGERHDGRSVELVAELLASMGLHFVRTGSLPMSPDVLALHMTVVWCSAVGREITRHDIERIRSMFTD